MVDFKKYTEYLYKNVGIIGLIFGTGAILLGAFNIPIISTFYEAISGDLTGDANFTIYVNALLWFMCCSFLIYFGYRFYFLGKDVEKLSNNDVNKDMIQMHFIGASIITGLMVYLILLLLNIVQPAQFYPHFLFAGEETPLDLSIIFNALLFYLLIEILHRIGGNFIKHAIEMGDNK